MWIKKKQRGAKWKPYRNGGLGPLCAHRHLSGQTDVNSVFGDNGIIVLRADEICCLDGNNSIVGKSNEKLLRWKRIKWQFGVRIGKCED